MLSVLQRTLACSIGALLSLSLFGCHDTVPLAPAPPAESADNAGDFPVPQDLLREVQSLETLASAPDGGLAKVAAHGKKVEVPAGSTNALAAAIAAAGKNGTVILKEGLHTESGTVLVTTSVTLAGESGAVLKSTTAPLVTTPDIVPALHIKNAPNVTVWGIEFAPTGAAGGTGILVESSSNCLIAKNTFHDYQYSILLHNKDGAMVWKNHIVAAPGWMTGTLPEAHGIIAMNGRGVRVVDNDVAGALFGIWACDKEGFGLNNKVHDNFIGLILCCVPEQAYKLPGGELVGSAFPATKWLVRGNDASNNSNIGYLVIDEANHNVLVRNTSSHNAAYDMELTADTYRFGFLTPASHDNLVIVGHTPMIVKNCGNNNSIVGGTLVNTTLDPCN